MLYIPLRQGLQRRLIRKLSPNEPTFTFLKLGFGRHRIFGLDFARGVAVLGMFILHALPQDPDDATSKLLLSFAGDNRPQILFAILDGIVVGILTTARNSTSEQSNDAVDAVRVSQRRRLAVRGVALIALGLYLTTVGSPIVIIIDYYGVFLLISLFFVKLKLKPLLFLSLLLFVIGPSAAHLSREIVGNPTVGFNEVLPPISDRILSWLLVGQYPAIIYMAYIALGLYLYRRGLGNLRVCLSLLAIGSCIEFIGAVTSDAAMTPNSLLKTSVTLSGSGFLMGGFVCSCVIVSSSVRSAACKRFARLMFFPVALLGSMPLTVYVVHVWIFSIMLFYVAITEVQSEATLILITGICLSIALAWSLISKRGPVEGLINRLVGPASKA